MSEPVLTPEAFGHGLRLVYGSVDRAAQAFGVSARAVYFWMNGSRPIPKGITQQLAADLVHALGDESGTLVRLAAEWVSEPTGT